MGIKEEIKTIDYKPFFQSSTIILNIIGLILLIVKCIVLKEIKSEDYAIAIAVIGNIINRFRTNKAIK